MTFTSVLVFLPRDATKIISRLNSLIKLFGPEIIFEVGYSNLTYLITERHGRTDRRYYVTVWHNRALRSMAR